MSLRNILIVIGAVAIPVVALIVIGTLLNVLAPLAITAVVAFVLGRLSVNFDLIKYIRSARAARQEQATQATINKAAATLDAAPPVQVSVKPAQKPATQAVPPPAPEAKITKNDLLDPNFEIKTPEQIEAEAKQREAEIMKGATSAPADSVAAALEERRKRLLGGKTE